MTVADYCDTFLTHDSPAVRRQHNEGYKHKAAVRNYYMMFEEQGPGGAAPASMAPAGAGGMPMGMRPPGMGMMPPMMMGMMGMGPRERAGGSGALNWWHMRGSRTQQGSWGVAMHCVPFAVGLFAAHVHETLLAT
jgi:hypothetical protein